MVSRGTPVDGQLGITYIGLSHSEICHLPLKNIAYISNNTPTKPIDK